jgi:hypothetical protein
MMEQSVGYNARALRVIGQNLAELIPENLTVETEGESLVVRGTCSKRRFDEQESRQSRSGIRTIGAKLAEAVLKPSREPELEFVSFTRTYNPADIDYLDQQASQRRTNFEGLPDIYTLAERLRTIGKLIDSENGRLLRVFKDEQHVVFEYLDGAGSTRKQDLNNTELYHFQTGYASQRKDVPPSVK